MRTILPGGKLGGRIDNLTMLKITRAAPSEISKTVILKKIEQYQNQTILRLLLTILFF